MMKNWISIFLLCLVCTVCTVYYLDGMTEFTTATGVE